MPMHTVEIWEKMYKFFSCQHFYHKIGMTAKFFTMLH